jgi:hypothetical protein
MIFLNGIDHLNAECENSECGIKRKRKGGNGQRE